MRWFRGAFSAVFVGAITTGFFLKLIPWTAFLPIAAAAVAWWYKERDKEKLG